MKRIVSLLWALAVIFSCGKPGGGEDEPEVPEAPSTITVSPESLSAQREGGTFSLSVKAPTRPGISSDVSWVSITDGTYKDYSITYAINVQAYGDYGSREATLTVTAGTLSKTVTLTQQGREYVETNVEINKNLVTPNPTEGANDLYGFLMENYGKKCISSVMADVNWNTKIARAVYQNTGKYPAMNCFDFIHIYVPENNWINYSDIKPVTDWHSAGGIVSLMWHFNVPLSESTQVKTDGSGVTCSPDKTTFKASNALKDGTWEHDWYIDQMDKVATIILQLQEQGIAAIWRPYHEAAGNYYALQWSGSAWFWWGAEGPEVFKALWNDMFSRFADKGIRNLIWVWTAQNQNGNPSAYGSDEAWYPGDDKVDIVARDIYGSTTDNVVLDFTSLQNTYNHKMITLGECGRGSSEFPALSGIWAGGGAYSWFMPWYDSGATMVSWNWWKAAFDSGFVISREDLPEL